MKDEQLFLNVDDPSIEHWGGHWVSASEMLLELHYDIGQLKRVRTFLQNFEPLLLAAGTEPLKGFAKPSIHSRQSTSKFNTEELRTIFNSMRISGELLDVKLVPLIPSLGDSDTEQSFLAHRSFLAACIPHVRAGAEGWKNSQEIQFPGSATGAKALLGAFSI